MIIGRTRRFDIILVLPFWLAIKVFAILIIILFLFFFSSKNPCRIIGIKILSHKINNYGVIGPELCDLINLFNRFQIVITLPAFINNLPAISAHKLRISHIDRLTTLICIEIVYDCSFDSSLSPLSMSNRA